MGRRIEYTYDSREQLVRQVQPDGTIITYTHAAQGLATITFGGTTYRYHYNHRGDTLKLTDTTGAIRASYAYTPWGEITPSGDATVLAANHFTYNGRDGVEHDPTSGLYWMRARWYSAQQSRFLSVDTKPNQAGTADTAYGYAGNDPVNNIDPSGTSSKKYYAAYNVKLTQEDSLQYPLNRLELTASFTYEKLDSKFSITAGSCGQTQRGWIYPLVESHWTIESATEVKRTSFKKGKNGKISCTTKKVVAVNGDTTTRGHSFLACQLFQDDPPKSNQLVRSHYKNTKITVNAKGKYSFKSKRSTSGPRCRNALHKDEKELYVPDIVGVAT